MVGTLTLILAGLLSSPDIPAVTVQAWASRPGRFRQHRRDGADGASGTAGYGQPYNNGPGGAAGRSDQLAETRRHHPADRRGQDFVIGPLTSLAKTTPALATALAAYTSASQAQQNSWATAYDKATSRAPRRRRSTAAT